jgi:hypothetical protein
MVILLLPVMMTMARCLLAGFGLPATATLVAHDDDVGRTVAGNND